MRMSMLRGPSVTLCAVVASLAVAPALGQQEELLPQWTEIPNPAFPLRAVEPVAIHRGRMFVEADVALYFTGELAEAKAAFDRGHYDKARRLLQGRGEAPPVRYLRALSALRAGDFAGAAKELRELAQVYTVLKDRCWTHAGIALEELGRHREAAAAFEQVEKGSRLYSDARLGLARTLRKLGEREKAAQALEPLAALSAPGWGRDIGAEALVALADLAREGKDSTAERDALTRLWSGHPLSSLAEQAEKRLGGAAKLPRAAHVARAEAWIDAHRNKQGLAALQPLLPQLSLPDPLACRAHFAFGKALRKERQHTKAIEVLSPVVQRCQDPDLQARAMYVLASSQSIVAVATAPATYEALAERFGAHSFADDALFYAADAYMKVGDEARALERLEALVEKYPQGDFAGEAFFKIFWAHRAAGRAEQALRTLEQLEARFGDRDESHDVERARYWRARVLESAGQAVDAAALLESLAASHPTTYYGLIARERLQVLSPQRAAKVNALLAEPLPEPASPWPQFAGAMSDDPRLLAGVELLRLGFKEAVSSELLAVPRANQPVESVRLLVELLSRAGDTRAAHAIARTSLRRDLSGPITSQTLRVWQLAYPAAYRDLIERHCRTADALDPNLLQALMREESALDPKALSWAGAMGLTQLMPATAKAVAARLKMKSFRVPQLLDPDVNIRLGAAELAHLMRRFAGVKQLALAGYNAGPGAVNRWRQAQPEQEIDVWVEEIPIAETRGYVKRVLRSYNTYRLLYRGEPRANPLSLREGPHG